MISVSGCLGMGPGFGLSPWDKMVVIECLVMIRCFSPVRGLISFQRFRSPGGIAVCWSSVTPLPVGFLGHRVA